MLFPIIARRFRVMFNVEKNQVTMSEDERACMERTHLAHNVWYINYSDTFKRGVFLFVENNTQLTHQLAGYCFERINIK